ncbi:hypothetical protein GALMADRAFT_143181 [Galerina marginata CBS 339.88]|uniref:Uncharacterized protein n=1 Tax=Galerina marginata (strain CBS 339.88) TaxID=685588 RepID=A0A067SN46_GALM3|nr:hypothetical protein GALMADRAFT_143181 [Galerina marginata CBS 339.88]
MHTSTKWLLCLTTITLLPQLGLCFGAGKVGEELKGHAFLHGGQTLLKIAGVAFTKREVDAIYFGNWLRDYSQAMDIVGLGMFGEGGKAEAKDAILLVIQVLSFMSFGFATREFKVTFNKLGVYSHAEHIDNPTSAASFYHTHVYTDEFAQRI